MVDHHLGNDWQVEHIHGFSNPVHLRDGVAADGDKEHGARILHARLQIRKRRRAFLIGYSGMLNIMF